jgi:hypothetical protein
MIFSYVEPTCFAKIFAVAVGEAVSRYSICLLCSYCVHSCSEPPGVRIDLLWNAQILGVEVSKRNLQRIVNLGEWDLETAQKTRGVASIDARLKDVFCHDRAGSNYDPVTDQHGKDGSICPDADVMANLG